MFLSPPIPAQRNSEIHFASPAARMLRFSTDHRAELASDALHEALLAEAGRIVAANDIEVLSFDVFDTALLRAPHCEARRFYEVSGIFAGQQQRFGAEDAFISRVEAARAAYAMAIPAADGTREGRLPGIASLVCEQLLVPGQVQQYLDTELAYEKKHLVANPLVKKLIADFPHLRVVFISDMYLDAAAIRALLADAYGEVEVYSSADGKGSKRSGGLFEHVAKETGIALGRFLHAGDSLEGDFRAIRKLGGHSLYLPLPEAERKTREACYGSLRDELAATGIDLPSLLTFNC